MIRYERTGAAALVTIDRQERRMLQSAAERLGLQQRLQQLLAGK